MSDLKVSLVLQLKNLLGRGIGQIRGDLRGLKSEVQGLSSMRGPNAAGLDRYGRSAREAALAMRQLKREQAILGAAHGAGRAPGAARAGAASTNLLLAGSAKMAGGLGVGYGMWRLLSEAARQAINFDAAVAEIRKKVDGVEDKKVLEQVIEDVKRMSAAYGIAQTEMAGLVAEAGASGIAVKDLSQFMNLAAKASVGWDMSAREVSQVLAQIKAGSQMTVSEMKDFADMVNYLGDSSAAKERDIVEMFQRSGEAAKAAGVDMKSTLAFLTGARSMGIQTEIGGRFFGAFTSKMVNPTKKGAAALKELGLSADGVKKGMETKPFETMITVLDKLRSSARRAEFAKELFGAEWFDEALRVAGGIKEVKRAYEGLQNSANWRGSLNKGLDIQLSTTKSHLDRLKALAGDVGDRLSKWALPPLNAGIEKLIGLTEKLLGRTPDAKTGEDRDLAMKAVSDYETGAQAKDRSAEELEASAKTTKNRKDRKTLQDRAARERQEAEELRQRADDARETGRAFSRMSGRVTEEREAEEIRKRLAEEKYKLDYKTGGGRKFSSPEEKEQYEAIKKRIVEHDEAQKPTPPQGRDLGVIRGEIDAAKTRVSELQNKLATGGGGRGAFALEEQLKAARFRLAELEAEAAKAGAAIKDKLSMDLSAEGNRAAASFAQGFSAGTGPALAAAQAFAASLRATVSMPAAPVGGGGRPATGGGASAPAKAPIVQVGGISIQGAADPEATARAVERRLASAVRSGLSGAHHDGVA